MAKASIEWRSGGIKLSLAHQPCFDTAGAEDWCTSQDHPMPLTYLPYTVADFLCIGFGP